MIREGFPGSVFFSLIFHFLLGPFLFLVVSAVHLIFFPIFKLLSFLSIPRYVSLSVGLFQSNLVLKQILVCEFS